MTNTFQSSIKTHFALLCIRSVKTKLIKQQFSCSPQPCYPPVTSVWWTLTLLKAAALIMSGTINVINGFASVSAERFHSGNTSADAPNKPCYYSTGSVSPFTLSGTRHVSGFSLPMFACNHRLRSASSYGNYDLIYCMLKSCFTLYICFIPGRALHLILPTTSYQPYCNYLCSTINVYRWKSPHGPYW